MSYNKQYAFWAWVVTHPFNPRIYKPETGLSLWVPRQPGLHSNTLSQNTNEKQKQQMLTPKSIDFGICDNIKETCLAVKFLWGICDHVHTLTWEPSAVNKSLEVNRECTMWSPSSLGEAFTLNAQWRCCTVLVTFPQEVTYGDSGMGQWKLKLFINIDKWVLGKRQVKIAVLVVKVFIHKKIFIRAQFSSLLKQ